MISRKYLNRAVASCDYHKRHTCVLSHLNYVSLLVAFVELRKATITSVMSLRPCGITRVPVDGFSWNLIF